MIPKHAIQLIEATTAAGNDKLNRREVGFIASVSIQAKQGRRLTDKQAKYLQDLYARASGGGQYQSKEYVR